MSRLFNPAGDSFAVTWIQAGPCQVLQEKTAAKDGYSALQLGFEPVLKASQQNRKSRRGKNFKVLREMRLTEGVKSELKVGDAITVEIFQVGDKLTVAGVSKGKGFQGVVKRHGFAGRDSAHGARHEERKGGSIGNRWPQRVVPGRKMAGHMGEDRVTVKNLKVLAVDKSANLLALAGALPGRKGALIELKTK